MKRLPTLNRIRELLTYEPDTGLFRWNLSFGNGPAHVDRGDVAGSVSNFGYVRITIDGRPMVAHRIAIFYVTGRWPKADTDHIDGDRSNNRFTNLRQVTRSENNENVIAPRKDNLNQLRGVSNIGNCFFARITVNKVNHYLGSFSAAEAAHAAYVKAKTEMHLAAERGIRCIDRGQANRRGATAPAASSNGSPKPLYRRGQGDGA